MKKFLNTVVKWYPWAAWVMAIVIAIFYLGYIAGIVVALLVAGNHAQRLRDRRISEASHRTAMQSIRWIEEDQVSMMSSSIALVEKLNYISSLVSHPE